MPSTTRYKRGDIVLVSFPFTDLSSSKRRPALVISPDAFNEHGRMSSSLRLRHKSQTTGRSPRERNDFVEGTLPKPSFVKVAKIFTMHSTLVLKRIGALRREKFADVLQELRGFLP